MQPVRAGSWAGTGTGHLHVDAAPAVGLRPPRRRAGFYSGFPSSTIFISRTFSGWSSSSNEP